MQVNWIKVDLINKSLPDILKDAYGKFFWVHCKVEKFEKGFIVPSWWNGREFMGEVFPRLITHIAILEIPELPNI